MLADDLKLYFGGALQSAALPSGIKRLAVEVGPATRVHVSEAVMPVNTYSAPDEVVVRVSGSGSDTCAISVGTTSAPQLHPATNKNVCLIDAEAGVEVGATVHSLPRLPDSVNSRENLAFVSDHFRADVTMELGASVHLARGGRVTVVRKIGEQDPIGFFDSGASEGPLRVETFSDGQVLVNGVVQEPPVLGDHNRFSISRLTIRNSAPVQQPAVFILVGPSAAGKTTMSGYMIRRLEEMGRNARRYTEFPILLEMAQQGDPRFDLHVDGNGFELKDPSAYQDALERLFDNVRKDQSPGSVPCDVIIELAPDGRWDDSLTVPPSLMQMANVLHVSTDPEDCLNQLRSRAKLSGIDNHAFDDGVWRTLFEHDNSGFITQVAQSRQLGDPLVGVFYNHPGSDLIRAARQFVEYGVATTILASYQSGAAASRRPLSLPMAGQVCTSSFFS